MKPSRHNKVLGLAIGERSLFAAELVGADRPEVRKLAELVYRAGVSLTTPAELGRALGEFLRDEQFTAKVAVAGIPAKWLAVKPKDVPPADGATLANMLRLQAEAEFSTELKGLVYDYIAAPDAGGPRSVLLVATQRKYLEAIETICGGARLGLIAVTASAIALGEMTGRAMGRDSMVLAITPTGSELTAQREAISSGVRHLRPPIPRPAFVGELRRALSTLPRTADRNLVLWDGATAMGEAAGGAATGGVATGGTATGGVATGVDATGGAAAGETRSGAFANGASATGGVATGAADGLSAAALGQQLGLDVKFGDLPLLGVDTSAGSSNGEGRKYAAAVALALSGLGRRTSVDFLHSRLAAPKSSVVPRWVYAAVAVALLAIGGCVYAYFDLQRQQRAADDEQAKVQKIQPEVDLAKAFVAKVSFAQGWHGGEARYLACVRDLTLAIPEDGQTYATSLIIRENPPPKPSSGTNVKAPDPSLVLGQLYGKTSDQQRVQQLLDRLREVPAFTEVKLGGTQDSGREKDVSFSITFAYLPPKTAQ